MPATGETTGNQNVVGIPFGNSAGTKTFLAYAARICRRGRIGLANTRRKLNAIAHRLNTGGVHVLTGTSPWRCFIQLCHQSVVALGTCIRRFKSEMADGIIEENRINVSIGVSIEVPGVAWIWYELIL